MKLFTFGLLLCAASSGVYAQSNEAGLKNRLVHKPLYLRGSYREDKLQFDGSGKLLSSSAQLSFTLCGIDISKVKLQSDKLILEGKRIGIEIQNDKQKRVILELPDSSGGREEFIHLEIAATPDYGPALDNIFAKDLADLTPSLPSYWQSYARSHFLQDSKNDPASLLIPGSETSQITGPITPPILIQTREPSFNAWAGQLRHDGAVLIGLVVAPDGTPSKIRVVRPIGLGLDEQAMAAISHYSFKPAQQNGNPVPVELNVEVVFHAFSRNLIP